MQYTLSGNEMGRYAFLMPRLGQVIPNIDIWGILCPPWSFLTSKLWMALAPQGIVISADICITKELKGEHWRHC